MAGLSYAPAFELPVRNLPWVEPPASMATPRQEFVATDTTFSWVEAAPNPFAGTVDQSRVLAAVHRSKRLDALARHRSRPLPWQLVRWKEEGDAHDSVGNRDG